MKKRAQIVALWRWLVTVFEIYIQFRHLFKSICKYAYWLKSRFCKTRLTDGNHETSLFSGGHLLVSKFVAESMHTVFPKAEKFSSAMIFFYLKVAFSHATFKGLVLGMMLLKLVTVIAIQLTLKVFLNLLKSPGF